MPTIGAGDDPAVSVVAPARTTSFDDFYRQHGRAVVGLAFSLTADWAVAEEIAQDAFVQAYVRWRQLQDHPRARPVDPAGRRQPGDLPLPAPLGRAPGHRAHPIPGRRRRPQPRRPP